MPTIEVLICTIDRGIENIAKNLLPPVHGVSYLISWQQTQQCPEENITALKRPDIRIITMEGKGLSRNRNNALVHAQGDILLIADDDVCYRKEYFQNIWDSFAAYPNSDILTFQIKDKQNFKLKPYYPTSYLYQDRPKGTYVSSLEIALKNKKPLPLFNTDFGLGSKYLCCGEEEIFVHEAFRNGAVIRYIPKVIGETNSETTGRRFAIDAKVRRSKGAVLYFMHGFAGALLRCAKFAYSLPCNRYQSFKDMRDGILYAQKIFKK